MAYYHKTFRKCGSHHSELAAIEGVEIKIGEKFRPPSKITLPVGFHPNDPSEVLSLSYDFTLENKIVAKAEEEKQRQLELQKEQERLAALTEQEQRTESTSTTTNESVPISIFSNVGTDILQPVAVSSTTHKRNDSLGKNTFDLSDFEANTSSPFELVELQTINDLDVLKSVLEPVTHSSTVETSGSAAIASADIATNVTQTTASSSVPQSSLPNGPFSYLSNQTPIPSTDQVENANLNSRLSKSVPDLCNDQLVDLFSGGENDSQLLPDVSSSSTSRSISPPSSRFPAPRPNSDISMGYGISTQPFNYMQGGLPIQQIPSTQPQSNPFLVNVNSQTSTSSFNASSSLTSSASNAQVSLSTTGANFRHRLPPLQRPPPVPPRPAGRTNKSIIDNITSNMQGLVVADSPSSGAMPPPVTCSSGIMSLPGNDMDDTRRHSTPLPPIIMPKSSPPPSYQSITSPPPPPYQSITSPPPPPYQSQSVLPDPTPVLTDSEKSLVQYIAAMGFPGGRVARAVQRHGTTKDREVVDFLVAVEELCQKGFSGDDAEVAMMLNNDDSTKAQEFLKLVKTFKELGFEETHIHEALRAADNDRDKALDFLASISAS